MPHLLRRPLAIIAWFGTERDPAPDEERRLAAAVTGTTRPLLPPDLACAAGDFAARLRRARPQAAIGKMREQCLVHDRSMRRDPEPARRQFHGPRALPLREIGRASCRERG